MDRFCHTCGNHERVDIENRLTWAKKAHAKTKAELAKLKESNLLLIEEAKDKDRTIRDLGKRGFEIEGENIYMTRELAEAREEINRVRVDADKLLKLDADLAKALSDLAMVEAMIWRKAKRILEQYSEGQNTDIGRQVLTKRIIGSVNNNAFTELFEEKAKEAEGRK